MCSKNVCPGNVELYWSKFAAYHRKNLMLKTLNPEILKNSPGWVWVAKKSPGRVDNACWCHLVSGTWAKAEKRGLNWDGFGKKNMISFDYNTDISKLYGHHSDNSISI